MTVSTSDDVIVPGSRAMYLCDDNHQLSGSSVRVCQEDGTWSESEPTCEGMWDDNQLHVKYTPYHPFAVIICPDLTPPDNGNVNRLGNAPGSLALYACNDNFELSGDMSRECGPNGQWTGEAPLCEGEEVMSACCHNINIPEYIITSQQLLSAVLLWNTLVMDW